MSGLPSRTINHGITTFETPADLFRVILVLALPVTASNILHTLVGFVDTRMLSELDNTAIVLDAIGPGRTSMWMLMSVFMGLGVGITAYVARFTGSGQHDKARAFSTLGTIAGGVIGVLMMAAGLLVGSEPVMRMVTGETSMQNPEVLALTRKYAWDYLSILLIGLGGVGVQFSVVSVYNALGRTIFPMWLLVLTNIANFLGNWYLIPRYEVAGCAWSTTLTTAIVAAVGVVLLARQGALAWAGEVFVRPFGRAWDMIKLGLPVTIQVSLRAMAMLALFKIITLLPDFREGYMSALHVGIQAESLAFMPAFAFSTAAATVVGQNLGANRVDKARHGTMYCVYGSQIIMWIMAVAFWFWPEAFITLFIGHNAPNVTVFAGSFLKIMALCLPGLGVGMVMMGVLRGSGDTQITALITIGAIWIFRIPLVIFMAFSNIGGSGLGLGMGLDGIWWAMTISVYAETGLAYWRYSTGIWTRVILKDD
jgi:putative MATE family efflux protein